MLLIKHEITTVTESDFQFLPGCVGAAWPAVGCPSGGWQGAQVSLVGAAPCPPQPVPYPTPNHAQHGTPRDERNITSNTERLATNAT